MRPIVATITPTRGDRPGFLRLAEGWRARQMHHIAWADPAPLGLKENLLRGLDWAIEQGAQFVAILEDDDWYHPTYLAQMLAWWQGGLVGLEHSLYYHLEHGGAHLCTGTGHASMYCTAGAPILLRALVADGKHHGAGLDGEIWARAGELGILRPLIAREPLAVGLKHGVGKCAGAGHRWPKSRWHPMPLADLVGEADADLIEHVYRQEAARCA